ncbi:MAG: F0F1 ATP synthase subunit delta [Propionibacteriaceae bacterium]|jgi:F-type H+-transporting ATPase subunit delta|nr:F0F1 ATP synthase subunit delta [Propionibacteriaceae bacterium]
MPAILAVKVDELDRLVDSTTPSQALADELFAVVQLLEEKPTVRNALGDYSAPEAARQQLAATLFGAQLSASALSIVKTAVAQRWEKPLQLLHSLDRLGIRVLELAAQAAGKLDAVEAELFAFRQVVTSSSGLRLALDDRTAPVASRVQLVRELIVGKVDPLTQALAEHAVQGWRRTYEVRLEDALLIAAEIRSRKIAEVTVAKPLTAQQAERLQATLTKQIGEQVNLQITVDPALIGGLRVRVGDDVIDGTVSGRLDAARKELK